MSQPGLWESRKLALVWCTPAILALRDLGRKTVSLKPVWATQGDLVSVTKQNQSRQYYLL